MRTNNILKALFASLILNCQVVAQELGNLPLGYQQTWTARLLYNSEGGYSGNYNNEENDIHGWSKLYEAQENDVYTISMPTIVSTPRNGRVQFKTPITIQEGHTYKFQAVLRADKRASVQLQLTENEDDRNEFYSMSLTLEGGRNLKISRNGLKGTDIGDMKLALNISTEEENTTISLSGIKLYDETEQKELWVGTSYYNYCYYRDEDSWTRIKDMQIDGRVETLSWTDADFDDSMWAEAEMPIGNKGYMNEVKTIWQGGDNTNYWIRRDFNLDEVKNTTAYYIKVCHDDAYSIYVNGHLIDSQTNWTDGKNPITIEIPARYLKVGRNVIATYIQQNWGGHFYDVGMSIAEDTYDEGDIEADIPTSLIATEVNVANIDQTIDYSWNYGGWVELYNKSDKRISLRYLYISDDANDLKKFMLPDLGIIEPNGYKCIFFDHNAADGTFGDQATKQVPFKLNIEGGEIFLSEDGRKPFLTIQYPTAIARCSWARTNLTDNEWGYNGDPTPEEANNAETFAEFRLNAPKVDTDSHLFTNPFDVRVDIPAGATLRYTTDGTTPTLQNGMVSKDGIFHISETTSLRLRLFQKGYLPSQVITRSYIYKDEDYYLPVLAITTNPDNLYDDMIGVYVDGTNGVSGRNHGNSNINMDWERPVNFEYITPEGKMVINQEAEFIISGGWSRHYAPSSFKLKASRLYEGTTSFDYPFFRYKPYNKYKQLQIRNGGNDNNSHAHGRVRDAITQQVLISNGFYIDAQDYQPVHVFFNGEYIGMLNLREPNNRYNGTANYGYDDDEMDAFEYSNGYFQKAGTKDAFSKWLSLSKRAADDEVYNEIRQKVDMDEVINFFAAISYIGCSDWICNHNNVKGYRSLPDGKFHLVLHDQDWGWSNNNGVSLINNNNSNELLQIYNGMKKNPQFQRQFVNAYCLLGGSVFTPERCNSIGDSICKLVEPALAFEGKQPWTSYNEQIGNMTSNSSREARINALRLNYGLGAGMKVSFKANIPQASLMVDNLPVPGNSFDGTLFAPVTLTATAPAGYRFTGWVNESTCIRTNQLTLTEDADDSYTALFEPISNPVKYAAAGASPIRINEVSANNSIYANEYAKKDDWIELYNTTHQDIDIAGMYLSDDADNPAKYQIVGGNGISTIIPAHGTLIIWASKRKQGSQLHAPFKLENTEGATVIIQAEDGSWTDVLCYNAQGDKQSYGRYPDGGNLSYLMNIPTINKSNVLSTYDSFTIADLGNDNGRIEKEQEIIDKVQLLTPDIAGQLVSTEYYSVDGQKLAGPTKGICICKQIFGNGTIIVKKIAQK